MHLNWLAKIWIVSARAPELSLLISLVAGRVHKHPKDVFFFTYIFETQNKCSLKIANVFIQFPVVLAEIGDSPAKWCWIFSLS